jgi:hypothetical protein
MNIKRTTMIAINMMRKMALNNSLMYVMIIKCLFKKLNRRLFLQNRMRNIMFQVLVLRSNKIEMILDPLNKEIIETINHLVVKEYKDLNLLKTFEVRM